MLQTTETRGNKGIYLPTGLSPLWQDFELKNPLALNEITRTHTKESSLPTLTPEYFESLRKQRAEEEKAARGRTRLGVPQRIALGLGALFVIGGAMLLAGRLSTSNAAEYQGPKIETATPVPTSLLRTTALPKSLLRSVEAPHLSQFSIDFYIPPDHYNWSYTNATFGINPPNNPGIGTGTINIVINGVWDQNKDFQPLQSLYQSPLRDLGISGMAVDIALDKYYLGTGSFVGSDPVTGKDKFAAHAELGIGVTTPYSYTGRLMADRNLPVIYGDSSQYITLGTDINGNYLNMMFDDAVDPVKNGTYQIRRNQNGIFIGDTFILLSDNPTATATLTPTLTSTATVTSTITSTPTSTPSPVPTLVLPFHSYLPGVMKN